MASLISYSSFYIIIIISILHFSSKCHSIKESDESSLAELAPKPIKQKLSHFHVYWHDIFSGRAPTSVRVVNSPPKAPNGFGNINMFDNPLTLGPDVISSKTIGRAQGFYAVASEQELVFLVSMNFVFTYGKYNGSTITILGRNAALHPVREMPVIGGSGLFRFARGYAQARTHKLDTKSGDTTVKYDVYVMHY